MVKKDIQTFPAQNDNTKSMHRYRVGFGIKKFP